MQSSVPNYETGNFIVTLNKSPSRYNSNVPPCISVSDCAIDNPRPLPSVLLVPLISLILIKIRHMAYLSADAPKIMLIVFLAVITPSASTVTQMCQVYGNDSRYASAINVVTTLCAVVTMPVMVLLYEEFI